MTTRLPSQRIQRVWYLYKLAYKRSINTKRISDRRAQFAQALKDAGLENDLDASKDWINHKIMSMFKHPDSLSGILCRRKCGPFGTFSGR